MNAKDAIARAKTLLSEFYADEPISGVRLEEVEFDEPSDCWLITLGLLRPGVPQQSVGADSLLTYEPPLQRTYKVMRIPNATIAPPSMKMREFHAED